MRATVNRRIAIGRTRPTRRQLGRVLPAAFLTMIGGPNPALGDQDRPKEDETCSIAIEGVVRDTSGEIPLPGVTVVAEWDRPDARLPEPLERRPAEVDGSFRLCPPPGTGYARIWAELGEHTSDTIEWDVDDVLAVELRIDLNETPAGRLVGVVRDSESGGGVATASILLGGVLRGTSNSRGEFLLSGLRPGSYELSVSHIGYATASAALDVASGTTHEVEVTLPPNPIEVEPIVVSTTRSHRLEVRGFYERKRWGETTGLGAFLTADDIERRRPLRITHMLRSLPGVRVECSGSGMFGCAVRMVRGPGCAEAAVYIDGIRLRIQGSIDEHVLPIEVAGVEVYRGPSELPAEFSGTDARCGAVVLWTK